MKVCSKCKQLKPDYCFHKRGDRDTLRSHCKDCRKKESNKYRQKSEVKQRTKIYNKTTQYRNKLKFHYEISFAQYMNLLVKQNGVCAICGERPNKKKLNVDHNHQTGKIRGLLCWRCNSMLGKVNEDTAILRSMIGYLEKYENAPTHKEVVNVTL